MKRLLIFIVLFFIAIATAPFLIDEKGYILIVIGDHARETTVTAAIAMLLFIFLSLLVFGRVIKRSFSLGLGAWYKITTASKRRALKGLNRGIAAYLLEDYQQAEHLLAKSAEPANFQHIAYLMAACAAQKQSCNENSQHYLNQLDHSLTSYNETGLEAILITVKLLIAQQQNEQARSVLNDYHKHLKQDPRLLALEIELSLIEQRYAYVVEQLDKVRKDKYFTENKLMSWELSAFYGVFNEQIISRDSETLSTYWQKLPRKVKQRDAVIIAYCQVLAKHHIDKPLVELLLPVIKKGSNEKLLSALCKLPINKPDELIVAAQKQLQKNPNSAKWLSCLAHLASAGKQFAMAEKAFTSLFNLAGKQYTHADIQAFADVEQQQGHYQRAIELLQSSKTMA